MKLSWKNVLVGLLIAYVVYRMFFAREHNTNKTAMDATGWTAIGIFGLVILGVLAYLLYDYFVLKNIHY